jgi:hypothetical protein
MSDKPPLETRTDSEIPERGSDAGGNEQIDNYLRAALNIAWVELEGPKIYVSGPGSPPDLDDCQRYIRARLERITPWPDSPQPEAFPFIQKSGSQEGE